MTTTKNNLIPLFMLGGCIVIVVFFFMQRSSQLTSSPPLTNPTALQPGPCTPTFVDGGGPYYQANAPFREKIVPGQHNGEKLVISGKVVARDCVTPLANVTVDIWQANESGSYEDEWYRGQIKTNDKGEYSFETVVPKGYGEGTAFRPPHIHFKIWQNGQELITSQMFLPASRAQGIEEAYIMKLETREQNGVKTHQGVHTIVMP